MTSEVTRVREESPSTPPSDIVSNPLKVNCQLPFGEDNLNDANRKSILDVQRDSMDRPTSRLPSILDTIPHPPLHLPPTVPTTVQETTTKGSNKSSTTNTVNNSNDSGDVNPSKVRPTRPQDEYRYLSDTTNSSIHKNKKTDGKVRLYSGASRRSHRSPSPFLHSGEQVTSSPSSSSGVVVVVTDHRAEEKDRSVPYASHSFRSMGSEKTEFRSNTSLRRFSPRMESVLTDLKKNSKDISQHRDCRTAPSGMQKLKVLVRDDWNQNYKSQLHQGRNTEKSDRKQHTSFRGSKVAAEPNTAKISAIISPRGVDCPVSPRGSLRSQIGTCQESPSTVLNRTRRRRAVISPLSTRPSSSSAGTLAKSSRSRILQRPRSESPKHPTRKSLSLSRRRKQTTMPVEKTPDEELNNRLGSSRSRTPRKDRVSSSLSPVARSARSPSSSTRSRASTKSRKLGRNEPNYHEGHDEIHSKKSTAKERTRGPRLRLSRSHSFTSGRALPPVNSYADGHRKNSSRSPSSRRKVRSQSPRMHRPPTPFVREANHTHRHQGHRDHQERHFQRAVARKIAPTAKVEPLTSQSNSSGRELPGNPSTPVNRRRHGQYGRPSNSTRSKCPKVVRSQCPKASRYASCRKRVTQSTGPGPPRRHKIISHEVDEFQQSPDTSATTFLTSSSSSIQYDISHVVSTASSGGETDNRDRRRRECTVLIDWTTLSPRIQGSQHYKSDGVADTDDDNRRHDTTMLHSVGSKTGSRHHESSTMRSPGGDTRRHTTSSSVVAMHSDETLKLVRQWKRTQLDTNGGLGDTGGHYSINDSSHSSGREDRIFRISRLLSSLHDEEENNDYMARAKNRHNKSRRRHSLSSMEGLLVGDGTKGGDEVVSTLGPTKEVGTKQQQHHHGQRRGRASLLLATSSNSQ